MINREQVDKIIKSDKPNVQDMVDVIRFYVFDLKKEELLDINIPTEMPCIVNMQITTQLQLCYHMYSHVVNYYKTQETT